MAKKSKTIKQSTGKNQKTIPASVRSTEQMNVVWCFGKLDSDGPFRFKLDREEFDHKEMLSKIINYSNMTWSEVRLQTHDRGKSKHHFLDNYDRYSHDAKERVKAKKLEQDVDAIFSFAFNNTLRVIGLREGEKFHVIWFDPEHKFYPSKK